MPPKKSQAATKSALQDEDEPGPERPSSPNSDMLTSILEQIAGLKAMLVEQMATNNSFSAEIRAIKSERSSPIAQIKQEDDRVPTPAVQANQGVQTQNSVHSLPEVSSLPTVHGGSEEPLLDPPRQSPGPTLMSHPNFGYQQEFADQRFYAHPGVPPFPHAGPSSHPMQSSYMGHMGPQRQQEAPVQQPTVTLTLPPTEPFTKRLVELRDPIDYWTFEQDLNYWRLRNPHMLEHAKMSHYIDKKLLIGSLQLGQHLSTANFHLLTDDAVRQAISAFFRRSITTSAQFLDALDRISFKAAPLPSHFTHPEADLQPLLVYLHKLDSLYFMLADMCPAAVPKEDLFDRTQCTTIKYLVNSKVNRWFSLWRLEIFDEACKNKGRWPQISAWIQSRVRELQHLLSGPAHLYAQHAASPRLPEADPRPESHRRPDGTGRQDSRGESKLPFQRPRGLWQPQQTPAKPYTMQPRATPGAAGGPPRSGFPRSSLHVTEDDGDKDLLEADDDLGHDDYDEFSADTQSYFTPEEDAAAAHVHAMSSAASTLPCHMTLTTGACSKAGCTFNHTPEVLSRHHEKMLAALRKPA